MIKDGIALTRFFFWLETNIGLTTITELSLASRLLELRLKQANCTGESFQTIIAFKEHSALPHYSPDNESDTEIKPEGILLVDSGGQYLDGTTDITRSVVLGRPSSRQKKDFTLVLKGMIALALARFPAGTRGLQLDVLARNALWNNGLNYGHGTGHGVGSFLNVHEGPQSIGTGSGSTTVIEAGMLMSDEPAVYREGEYGIRIENLILCTEDEETKFGQFLKFETLSLCYIDSTLIEKTMLEQVEVKWINDYHSMVYNKLSPSLSVEEKAWLKEKTRVI
jgi:Xaa-Pro aminopeptidase